MIFADWSEALWGQLFALIGAGISMIGTVFAGWIAYKQNQLKSQVTKSTEHLQNQITEVAVSGDFRSDQIAKVAQRVEEVHVATNGMKEELVQAVKDVGIAQTEEAVSQGKSNTRQAVSEGESNTQEAVRQGIRNTSAAFAAGAKSEADKGRIG